MKIFDDTGHNDDFEVTNILYEDDDVMVAEVTNEDWYDGSLKVMIDKESREVYHKELSFYLFEK